MVWVECRLQEGMVAPATASEHRFRDIHVRTCDREHPWRRGVRRGRATLDRCWKWGKGDISCVSLHCSRTALALLKSSQASTMANWQEAGPNFAYPNLLSSLHMARFMSPQNLSLRTKHWEILCLSRRRNAWDRFV